MNRTIFTIDSRENIMFDVMRQYFKLPDEMMNLEICNMHDILIEQLTKKGVPYEKLKPALVPMKKHHEIVLVFDSQQIADRFYGITCHNAILGQLNKSECHSFLCGDYISKVNTSSNKANQFLYKCLSDHLDLSQIEYKSSEQLFLIYINNVTGNLISRLQVNLQYFQGFVGLVDVTCFSVFKVYISSILTNGFIQYHDIILQPTSPNHGYADEIEDSNELGYDFEGHGFNVRSIYIDLYDIFLTYKIERNYFNSIDASDQATAINAITPVFHFLDSAKIIVAPEKLEYLKREKGDTMKRIGFYDITSEYLAEKIKENINANYLFCMELNEEYNVSKFNIMLEFNTYKIVLGLKYDWSTHELKLITMY